MEVGNNGVEAGGDATGDIDPIALVFNLRGHFTEMLANGLCRGEIFPFDQLALVVVFVVARLEIEDRGVDGAVMEDATADTGRKGEVNRGTGQIFGFGKAGEVSVIGEKYGSGGEFFELGGEVEVVPWEVGEPERLIVFDRAGNGDGDGLEVFEGEIITDL